MSYFIEVPVLGGQAPNLKQGKVVIWAGNVQMVEPCKYESAIQGVRKDGVQIICAGVPLLVPLPYDFVAAQLLTGKSTIERSN